MDIYSYFLDNRLLESNVSLHAQNTKLDHDVKHLRLANVGLEKASEARFVDVPIIERF